MIAKASSSLLAHLAFLAAAAPGLACSRNVEPEQEGAPVIVHFDVPDIAADGMHQVVAIIDNGFDLSLPQYQGKIAGGYTVTCDPQEELSTSFADAKRQLLARYAVKDTSCHLVPGIALRKSAKIDAAAGYLAEWNRALAGQQPDPTPGGLEHVILGEESYNYHGTWTSSLVAYQNPNVRIVFVENEAQTRADSKVTCPSAEALQLSNALAQDPDIRAAYLASPPSSYSDEIAAMYRHHGVTLLNQSFGPRPLAKLQELCPEVSGLFATSNAIQAELAGAREAAINEKQFAGVALLNVRSAGNDGVTLSSMDDDVECPSDPRNVSLSASSVDVMVGSWTASASMEPVVSDFSNTGGCVSFYAPGDDIVTMSPGGFLAVLRGTSFSAPLLVRHLSLMPPATTPAAMLDALGSVHATLPMEWFPTELLYDVAGPTSQIVF